MAVYIYEPDAFEKMAQLEAFGFPTEDYRRCKSEEAFQDCSFDAFLREWRKCESLKEHDHPLAHTYPMPGPGFSGAIYGWGGWNRYAVMLSGEILYLIQFAPGAHDEWREHAENIGFRVR